MNALFLVIRSENGKTFGSYPSCKVYMYREKLEEVTLIFSKYQSTLLPLIQSGDRPEFVMPEKRDGRQTFVFFKSRRESMRAHES